MTKNEIKGQHNRMDVLRRRVREKRKIQKRFSKMIYPSAPRIDNVYIEGVKWIESLWLQAEEINTWVKEE